jgi:hypothetical protein
MEVYFPTSILALLTTFAPYFSANNFLYFKGFMLAYILLGQTRKTVANIARVCFFANRHLSSFERFLSQYQWDLSALQKQVVTLIQTKFGDKALVFGAYLAWIDTSLISKIKGRMAGVQKWHDHSGNPDRGDRIIGHHWALAGLTCMGMVGGQAMSLCFPLLADLISGSLNPIGFVVDAAGQAQRMGFWNSVCPLVAQLQLLLNNAPLRVVSDAYFSKAPFINWMLLLKVDVISRMRWDAVGWDNPEPDPPGKKRRGPKRKHPKKGKKWKLADLLRCFPLESAAVTIYGKLKTIEYVCRDVWIRDVVTQKIRMVVIKTKGLKPVILMSTDLTLTAAQIIHIYALRFPAEMSIRDCKQHFGLGDYQCVSLLAIIRYVGLALIGCSLWKLAMMDEKSGDWLENNTKTTPLSFTNASRSLRRFVVSRLFSKFAKRANLDNSDTPPDELLQMIV